MSSCACDWPSSLTVSRRALRRRLSDLLPVFDRLLRRLLRGVLDLVGHVSPIRSSSTLVEGTKRPAMNPTAAAPMASPIGLLSAIDFARPAPCLSWPRPAPCPPRSRPPAHRAGDGVLGARDLVHDRILLVADPPLHRARDVGLVAEGVDGVTHLLPRLLDSLLYLLLPFSHSTSSLTLSAVCFGYGCADFLDLLAPLQGQHACYGAPR